MQVSHWSACALPLIQRDVFFCLSAAFIPTIHTYSSLSPLVYMALTFFVSVTSQPDRTCVSTNLLTRVAPSTFFLGEGTYFTQAETPYQRPVCGYICLYIYSMPSAYIGLVWLEDVLVWFSGSHPGRGGRLCR